MATLASRRLRKRQSWNISRALLACGIAAPLVWVIANQAAVVLAPAYNQASQTISELSATYAPTRPFLVPVVIAYEGMVMAFGIGVWRSAPSKRALQITGGLLTGGAIIALIALAFPLTQPPSQTLAGGSLPFSDTMHNILAGGVATLLMFVTYGFGAAALGRRFRLYSILTAAAELTGGALMFTLGAGLMGEAAKNWAGGGEWVTAWVWMLWMAVLAMALLRRNAGASVI